MIVGPWFVPTVAVTVEDGVVELRIADRDADPRWGGRVSEVSALVVRFDVAAAQRVAVSIDEAVRVVQEARAAAERAKFEAERQAYQERLLRGVFVRLGSERAVHITRNMRTTLCSWPIPPDCPEAAAPAKDAACAACRDRARG